MPMPARISRPSGRGGGNRRFRGLEAYLRMLAIAKRLGERAATAAQKDPLLSGYVVQVSIAIPKVKLLKVTRDQIGAVLRGYDLDAHRFAFRLSAP